MSNNDPLTGAEQRITAVINTILDDIANQIATELDNATEIVAARFSLTRIAAMWARHVGRLIRALLDVAETAAQETSRDLNAPLPDDWHNLPGRYDTNTLPASLTGYVTDTERLIHTIGDRLTQAAIHTLAEGVAAGETLPQLRHRLRTLFAHDGTQLGPERADRIAATEACRAWNTATLAAARDMSGPDRFIVKQWLTRMDSHVREAHRRANGQIRLLDEPFSVGGVLMQAPGAPEAPPELTINCRCVLRVSVADRTAALRAFTLDGEESMGETAPATPSPVRTWSTPGDAALAFENQETGDGRVFTPGALYWDGPGPWPLQYTQAMLDGHDGAELAGAIHTIARDGDRIPGTGVLYLSQHAGREAVTLLEQGAPLGVSVDLDDINIEVVDTTGGTPQITASIPRASALQLADGGWAFTLATTGVLTAAGSTITRTHHTTHIITGPDGRIPAPVINQLTTTGVLTAAAGDADNPTAGVVVHAENSGDYLLRITRARIRGATLVTMPAYDRARIVLDNTDTDTVAAASAPAEEVEENNHDRVVGYVSVSPVPVRAADVADALTITVEAARRHLARAANNGHLVRLAPGLYIGAATLPEDTPPHTLTAAMAGNLDLPIHDDPETPWDGNKAASRVLQWATRDDGTVDPARLTQAFLWRDTDANPATLAAYKLGVADVFDTGTSRRLEIVPRAVYTVAAALQGARGGVNIPDDEQDRIRRRVDRLYERISEKFGRTITPPWADDADGGPSELEASAWTAMQDLPPMPAAWFREPTPEELPPGSGGVHYRNGRIYGWVAQAGEPHAGYPGRNLTIESLGDIDLTHFLRARFRLDDGSSIKVGALTMNVGHHRDGAECETAACQFDDTRTVAGIVTVGISKGGMWFSGAAAPWIGEWDRAVFQACQPSYHLKQGPDGRWQLRAVLSVPVPGHSSPLLASTVAERANLAIAASAQAGWKPPATGTQPFGHAATNDTLADVIASLLTSPAVVDRLATALQQHTEQARIRAEIDALAAGIADARQPTNTSTAPAVGAVQ